MTNMTRLARKVLNELAKEDGLSDQSLNILMEYLENKGDPSSSEVVLIDTIYQFLEKQKILESHLKRFIKDQNISPNKLEQLYEDKKNVEDWDL